MLLKSIKFTDFRCFRGTTTIDLSTNDSKNVVVILGDNSHGKSTIVQAFAWCFYGKKNFDNPEIYNRALVKELGVKGRTRAVVEVTFEHEIVNEKDGICTSKNATYTAKRYQDFIKYEDHIEEFESVFSLTYKDPFNGVECKCGTRPNEYAQAMNSIIHSDLAQFFFFAGERDNKLTTTSLSKAVRSLMGIEVLVKLREYLRGNTKEVSSNSVLGLYEKDQVSADNQKAQEEWKKKEAAELKIEKYDSEISKVDEQIEYYDSEIKRINETLREAAPTKAIQKHRDDIVRSKNYEEESLNRAYITYLNEFNDKAVNVLAYPLLKKALLKLKDMDLSDKGIKGLEVSAIYELLTRGYCLCGTQLMEGSLAYNNVKEYEDILPPKAVGTLVRHFQDSIAESENATKDFVKRSIENYTGIQRSINRLHELERDEQQALSDLKEVKDINIGQYERDLRDYSDRIRSLREDRDMYLAFKQTELSKRITAQNNFNMYRDRSKKNAENALYYAYAQDVYEWMSKEYDFKERTVRENLEVLVTKLFNSIYSGNRTVSIDEKYNMKINPPADAGGVKAIQYFSYVGGLIQLASKAMDERTDGQIVGGKYPLVLDAAFSHTDRVHTKSIAMELSNVTDQLIFAVMDKDWEHVEQDISNRVTKTYRLVRITDNEAVIEEA